ncbi:uroporphyrinogen-III C-methyltransferase [Vibrio breoganii]|uniref:Uroporphyrinogen-III C-methyltransferase n=1 Tax=Vibrio breoganii TaxID=553239 RepID=A0ABX1U777_9VIBR|nr:uroporphyrinogen-III C-methyltransferase [Vibrio breoganii]NMO73604.1 heme biosynthesis operon protein HemX [Vibrio breoganii]NMR70319.1 uroporphyrinogen-III C-methyltransferase [Vibrio breoganii]PMF68885.1 heme biosynthesis operon protein HemX [Vibrio breoganii]PMH18499.1 heme biosynthesis operon protein HemX [Vibrio breoganii]PML86674.1 heme biosynthesis operon protein HemX [Vibrio breoganii]
MTDDKKLDDDNKVNKSEPVPASPVAKKTTAPSAKKPNTAKKSEENEPNKPAKRLAIAAVVISLLTAGAGFYYFNQQNQLLQQQLSAVSGQLKTAQQTINGQLQETQQSAAQTANEAVNRTEVLIGQQQKSIESLQLAISDVKGRRPNDWLLAEADYLVKLAGRKLFLEHDLVTATKLMEAADQRIATLNDPSLVPLRQAMANDITELRSLPLLDKDGVALQLIALQEQVDKLPLANAILPEAAEETKKHVSKDIQDWQTNLSTSLENFAEHFITFRVRDGSAVPLLSPQQHFYLRENIKAKLETAIKATYSEQEEIYRKSLLVALEWSQTYLDQDAQSVNEFESALDKLSKVKVDLEYPAKLETNQLIADIIRERLRREVTTIVTEENK